MFKISIIIPCYNVSPYIDRCLTSIINQTLGIEPFQIICVDDASTDDTVIHLQKWEQQYPDNFTLVLLDTNNRQGACRNIAMQYVVAPWVAFIDADDWVEPDYFEIMYMCASELECEIVCCSLKRDFSSELSYFDNRLTDDTSGYIIIDSNEKRKTFIHTRSMGYTPCCKLILTDFLKKNQIYFPEDIAYEDNLWSSLLHLYAKHIFMVEENLYHYFVNPNSTIMKENAAYHTDYITIYLRLWEEWKKRGFYPKYKLELEYDYLYSFYLNFLRITIVRYTIPQFSLFLLLKRLFLERVPDYKENPYIDQHFDDFHKLMLLPLQTTIGKKDFVLMAEHAKLYWAIHNKNN